VSDKREKLSILQTLTVNNLKEICEKNNRKGYQEQKSECMNVWGQVLKYNKSYNIFA
jgi:hypothetical protein